MPSPFCKTLHRRAEFPSSVPSFHFDAPLQKVQRAVLFPSFVEATLRNVSMLTSSRRGNEPVREGVLVSHPDVIYLDVEDPNLRHAEDRARRTWRVRVEESITVAGRTCLHTRFRNASRLTWSVGPRHPGVQPAEHFPRVSWASTGETIPSLAPKPLSSKPDSAMSGPDIISRRNELVQDRDAGDMWYAFTPPRERPCQY